MFRFGYMTIRELEQKIFSKNFFYRPFLPGILISLLFCGIKKKNPIYKI